MCFIPAEHFTSNIYYRKGWWQAKNTMLYVTHLMLNNNNLFWLINTIWECLSVKYLPLVMRSWTKYCTSTWRLTPLSISSATLWSPVSGSVWSGEGCMMLATATAASSSTGEGLLTTVGFVRHRFCHWNTSDVSFEWNKITVFFYISL